MKKIIILLLIQMVMIAGLAAPAPADGEENILRVGLGQGYATIQAAVDAAKSRAAKSLCIPIITKKTWKLPRTTCRS